MSENPDKFPTQPFLCCLGTTGDRRGYKFICPFCKSFWDLESLAVDFHYDDSYPELRHHIDPIIGELKIRTLQEWLKILEINLNKLNICEVGFGGAACLAWINEQAHNTIGIEVVEANLHNAMKLGLSASQLFHAEKLPKLLSKKIDLWLFQDSFEHLRDPNKFIIWMSEQTISGSRVLLVAPRADSFSANFMGRLWPHKLQDHHFHWSRAGLISFFNKAGFALEQEFYPQKILSLQMLISHIAHKFSWNGLKDLSAKLGPNFELSFSIGEQGLLFRRNSR